MEINVNDEELYTIILYNSKINNYNTIEVVSSLIEAGDLLISRNTNSILCINLDLSVANDLDILKKDKCRPKLKEIDTQFKFMNFKYKIKNLDKIKKELKKYKNIRIWVDSKNNNSFLFKLYFCNEFYKEIYDKNLTMANIEGFFTNHDKLEEFIDNDKVVETKLSIDELNKYKNEWDIQVKINSEIRDVRNGKIINLSYSDLYEPVLKIISEIGRVKRSKAISKLIDTDILNCKLPIIYNHIINRLVENKSLKVYMIDYTNKEIENFENEDEFMNNEIEYFERK